MEQDPLWHFIDSEETDLPVENPVEVFPTVRRYNGSEPLPRSDTSLPALLKLWLEDFHCRVMHCHLLQIPVL